MLSKSLYFNTQNIFGYDLIFPSSNVHNLRGCNMRFRAAS
jgi:hypothetical protein